MPRVLIIIVQHCQLERIMATRRDANAIARSLNRLTDSAFVGALSENDSAAVATLMHLSMLRPPPPPVQG